MTGSSLTTSSHGDVRICRTEVGCIKDDWIPHGVNQKSKELSLVRLMIYNTCRLITRKIIWWLVIWAARSYIVEQAWKVARQAADHVRDERGLYRRSSFARFSYAMIHIFSLEFHLTKLIWGTALAWLIFSTLDKIKCYLRLYSMSKRKRLHQHFEKE